jgi:hypothetical protein
MTPPNSAQLDAAARDRLLLQMHGEIAALRRDMATLLHSACGPDDPLLVAIFAAIGGAAFLSHELVQRAAIDQRLCHALKQARVTSAIGLSRRLSRLFRHPGSRLRLEKVGREEAGILWAVADTTQASDIA